MLLLLEQLMWDISQSWHPGPTLSLREICVQLTAVREPSLPAAINLQKWQAQPRGCSATWGLSTWTPVHVSGDLLTLQLQFTRRSHQAASWRSREAEAGQAMTVHTWNVVTETSPMRVYILHCVLYEISSRCLERSSLHLIGREWC